MHHRRKFPYKEASQKKNDQFGFFGKKVDECFESGKQRFRQVVSSVFGKNTQGKISNPRHVNDLSVTETQNSSIRQADNLSEQDLSDALDILSSINTIKQKIK